MKINTNLNKNENKKQTWMKTNKHRGGVKVNDKTTSFSGRQYLSLSYDLHNLNGYLEVRKKKNKKKWMQRKRKKKYSFE